MKRTAALLSILLMIMLLPAGYAEHETLQLKMDRVWEWLLDTFPDLTSEAIPDIHVEKVVFAKAGSEFSIKTDEFTVYFCYKGKEYLHTMVVFDANTGEVLYRDPWDFSIIVSFYDSLPLSEEDILDIARAEYDKRLNEARNNEEWGYFYSSFLDQYGEEWLDPDVMIPEIYLFDYPHDKNDPEENNPRWYVSFKHPKQIELNQTEEVIGWCSFHLDTEGHILDATPHFFQIYEQLNRPR